MRPTKLSVSIFIYCGDDYLFLLRSANKSVDAGRLNSVGGKLEHGEDYLTAAVRETKEETGYDISPENFRLSGVVRLEGGYPDDWVMCFFKAEVKDKTVPIGMDTPDGKLMWIHKDEVLGSGYELVDDLNYCWADIAENKSLFFMGNIMNEKEKVEKTSFTRLSPNNS